MNDSLSVAATAALLRLKSTLEFFPNEQLGKSIDELAEQIRRKRYCVAVAGEFKRGKSSLLNALLGMPVLPMGIEPMTATLNRITYGVEPKAIVKKKNGDVINIEIDELGQYVTQATESSRRMAHTVKETVIEYPTQLCANGIEILDTPGLNDTSEMSEITNEAMKSVQMIVFAVSATLPFSETEADWLAGVASEDSPDYIMFAITYIDRIRQRERERLLNYIRESISEKVIASAAKMYGSNLGRMKHVQELFDTKKMVLMPVASTDALDSFDNGDYELLQKSNIPEFKKELVMHLNARQYEYVRERVGQLTEYAIKWLEKCGKKNISSEKMNACDEAADALKNYFEKVSSISEQFGNEIASICRSDVYPVMEQYAKDEIQKGVASSNEEVHAQLQTLTYSIKNEIRDYYTAEWEEKIKPKSEMYTAKILEINYELRSCCENVVGETKIFKTEEEMRRFFQTELNKIRFYPSLNIEWTLDISGGVAKYFSEGVQNVGDKLANTLNSELAGKTRKLFKSLGERTKPLVQQVSSVAEGSLTGKNLAEEIKPQLSAGATQLNEQWQRLPNKIKQCMDRAFIISESDRHMMLESLKSAKVRLEAEEALKLERYNEALRNVERAKTNMIGV
ncbi:MAG: dynamin family protein [Clostridiales bacterium]|nr:dynamin family protein [Clostridiales bacterium]